MPNMPIDWTSVDWFNVGLLSAIAFMAALIGNILIFKHRFWAAILAGLLFAAVYVFLVYYPHGLPVPGLKTEMERIVAQSKTSRHSGIGPGDKCVPG